MDKIIEKWDEILNTVKQEYEISDVSFDTWIRPLEVFAIEGNTLYILVPSEQMALSYISKKYLTSHSVRYKELPSSWPYPLLYKSSVTWFLTESRQIR